MATSGLFYPSCSAKGPGDSILVPISHNSLLNSDLVALFSETSIHLAWCKVAGLGGGIGGGGVLKPWSSRGEVRIRVPFFSVVCFSRGTLPTKKRTAIKGHYWGTLEADPLTANYKVHDSLPEWIRQ